MYLTILFLPLLGSVLSGFFGRKIGVTGSHIITITCLILSSILASIAFYEVIIAESPVEINITQWVNSGNLFISWGFLFDSLSVSMLIPVLFISTLVHLFSVDYMSGDPHNQRFFSYLSLFTFFMLILVTGSNYLVMFVGWECVYECLKWFYLNTAFINECHISSIFLLPVKKFNYRYFFTGKFSMDRIGPHNIDIISIVIGSLLGDGHLEKRKQGVGTRIKFEQSSNNVEYLMWFHSYLSYRGYCNTNKPKLKKRIRKNGTVYYHYSINSFTFSSLNWMHDMFYKKIEGKYIKIIPDNIEQYLTPISLALWFMDDGSKLGKGAKIATNCFTKIELLKLCQILKTKFNLTVTVHSGGINKGYILYISTSSMVNFSKIIKPNMLPSLYYKLGNY